MPNNYNGNIESNPKQILRSILPPQVANQNTKFTLTYLLTKPAM